MLGTEPHSTLFRFGDSNWTIPDVLREIEALDYRPTLNGIGVDAYETYYFPTLD